MAASNKNEQKSDLIGGYQDINEFTQEAFKSIMGAIKSSNDLPSSGDDFDYYSSFESFRTLMDVEGSRILQIVQKMIRYHGARGNITSKAEHIDTEEKFDVLVDANDQLLERVGNYLDEAAGLRKKESPLIVATATSRPNKIISGSWNKKPVPAKGVSARTNFRLLAAKNIQRPQLGFKDKIDNSSRAFVPVIKNKPNALKPLTESLQIDHVTTEDYADGFQFPHPYLYELQNLKPLPSQMEKGTVTEPVRLADCRVSIINTEPELDDLVQLLKKEKEIAVDLEHHSYRSFQGITCLMQLSTRSHDFIIDTIELRSELHILNQVFTDPDIVKVFHGADLDVEWLQRDLGLYVVNMFDTGQASRVLNLQRFSLAHLLMSYCHVEADKQYQLADWRIRPLPIELMKYAQEDTHYLLYIYDRLRSELIDHGNDQNNLLVSVLQRSKDICEKTYKKPIFSSNNYLELYKRTKKLFNSQQLAALEGVYAWRDATARAEDESLGYVLPNHMLMQMCEILPREPQGILACCNPIPPLVRQNLIEIHIIVKRARETALVKPQPQTPKSLNPSKLQHPKYNVNSLLSCPHDLSHQDKRNTHDMEVDVPVASRSALFQDEADIHMCSITVKESPIITALGHPSLKKPAKKLSAQQLAAKIKATFSNPIEKFLPESILERINRAKVAHLTRTEDKWKLLPHTKKAPVSLASAPVPQHTVSSANVLSVEIEDPENSLSLRQQHPKTKKRDSDGLSEVQPKKVKEEEQDSSEVKDGEPKNSKVKDEQPESSKVKDEQPNSSKVKDEQPNSSKVKDKSKPKGAAKSDFLAPREDFKAYDYSQTNYVKVFSQSEDKKSKHYDPNSGESHSKYKGGGKGKGRGGSSKKSMTYNKGKSPVNKIQWPKR